MIMFPSVRAAKVMSSVDTFFCSHCKLWDGLPMAKKSAN